jgi:6-pyruvoyltetrahydropterin/6-carboxytetrahydropterin synthase
MFSTGVIGRFSCTHALVGDFEAEETVLHTHEYLLEWDISVSNLDKDGFGINIAHMEQVRDEVFTSINGVNLNDQPFFENRQSSIENVSVYLARRLMSGLAAIGLPKDSFHGCHVKIWENDHAWASFETRSLAEIGVQ